MTLPCWQWLRRYSRATFADDAVAAVIVAVMLVPQSLAYALLAGLPAEVGLYASVAPLVAYAVFGSSSTLSVGPVAITSLMTASALGGVVQQGSADYVTAAAVLAALSGGFYILFGVLRLGFLASFLSHTVVSAFVSASAVLIALSQLRHVLGISAHGETLPQLLPELLHNLQSSNLATVLLGSLVLLFLYLARSRGAKALQAAGLSQRTSSLLMKAAPVVAVLGTIAVTAAFALDQRGVAVVGEVPAGLPDLSVPFMPWATVQSLWLPALFITVIGYVESISVGRTLGAKRGERVENNQELIGLGSANLAAAVVGGLPVTGGFSRSVVNFDAGALTQAASIMTALLISLVTVLLTPALYFLPKATLAATIIIAVLSLIDVETIRKTWRYSPTEFRALAATLLGTLLAGVEVGVTLGVLLSIGQLLYRASRPHVAEVGRVPESDHFRNVRRFHVLTVPEILTLRVDESLLFANCDGLEDAVLSRLGPVDDPGPVRHVILQCSAVNDVDFSALETLEALNNRLQGRSIQLHLSEIKGPVLDRLRRSDFFQHLTGSVFLSQALAVRTLCDQMGYAEQFR